MNCWRIELFYTLVIIMGSISFGQSMSYWSPAMESISRDLDFKEKGPEGPIFNSLDPLLAMVGSFLINPFLQRFGRKKPLFIIALIFIVSFLMIPIAHAKSKWVAFLGRAINGLSIGCYGTACPLFITEISPNELRGFYGTMHQVGLTTGTFCALFWGIFFEWRVLAYILIIPSIIMAIFIWFVKESPAYERQNKIREDNLLGNIKTKNSLLQLFERKYWKALMISFLMMFFQQMSGVNAILTNMSQIFRDANTSLAPNVAAVLVGISGWLAAIVSSPIVDRFGRKPMWLVSSIGEVVPLMLIVLNEHFKWSTMIPVVGLFVNNFMFGIGLGPIPWYYIPELFPDSVRSIAMALFTTMNSIFMTIIMFAFPYMNDSLSFMWSVFVFVLVLVGSFVFGFFLPELKGMEMGALIEGSDLNSEPLMVSTDKMV